MKVKIGKEENEILESYDNDEWIEIPDMKDEIKKHAAYAKETMKKDKRINIRITQKDLESLQRKAVEEGIPYQTFISSILHKYNSGRLVERNN